MERLTEYLNRSGFWFASCEEYEQLAQKACNEGILQPIENLLKDVDTFYKGRKSYFYVRAQLKCKEELPIGMWRHFVEGIPC